jgi:hypothetical protein
MTGLLTITQGTANVGIVASTGFSLTGASTTPMISLAGTINSSGVVHLLDHSFTETSIAAGSSLLRFRCGAGGVTDRFRLDANGSVEITQRSGVSQDALFIKCASGSNVQIGRSGTNGEIVTPGEGRFGGLAFRGTYRFGLGSGCSLKWADNADFYGGSPDSGLARGSAGVIKSTNGSSGYGALDASAFYVSGTPGASGTGTVISSITVVNGIITAISVA